MAQTYEKGTLYQISIIDFKPDPDQPRKIIDIGGGFSNRICHLQRS